VINTTRFVISTSKAIAAKPLSLASGISVAIALYSKQFSEQRSCHGVGTNSCHVVGASRFWLSEKCPFRWERTK